jgi:hypothetical protein
MRSVWSLWSKPWHEKRGSGWFSERHHLFGWVLSVETARQHYPRTTLVTDDDGARLLVDRLGLGFERVSTSLNDLKDCDPAFWVLGKLWAYREQTEPFLHIDTDVFLWKRLPEQIESAPVFGQSPESFVLGKSHYRPEAICTVMTQQTRGWVPQEWEWCLSHGNPQSAVCCGLLGGCHVEFIRYFAESAIRCAHDERNGPGWALLGGTGNHLTLLEQYHLSACASFHRNRPDSPYRSVELRHLFRSEQEAFNPNAAAKVGFTHLLATAKKDRRIALRLEERVRQDYSELYERCLRCFTGG